MVSGSIAVKDSTGREHTFTNASVVSINNGTIIIESEWKPKVGELIKLTGCNTNCYCIYRRHEANYIYDYGFKKIADSTLHTKIDDFSWCTVDVMVSPVTLEEQQAFDDFCKSQGKIWNKEKLQWEDYKWSPKPNERYWYIASWGEVVERHYIATLVDQGLLRLGNAFLTEEKAKKCLKQMLQFFKSE